MKNFVLRTITATFIAFLIIFTFFFLPIRFFGLLIIFAVGYLLFFEWPDIASHVRPWLRYGVPLYFLISLWCMLHMNIDMILRPLLIMVFVSACCFDVGAYLAGSMWGKHLFAPCISPKKTWEGLCGGCLFTCTGLLGARAFLGWHGDIFNFLAVALLLATTACAGDLFESWLKRQAHIKDAGTLLPGHGGMFDRLDSILSVAIVVYVARNYLINILERSV